VRWQLSEGGTNELAHELEWMVLTAFF
jgi:hypothetical protein